MYIYSKAYIIYVVIFFYMQN